MRRQEIYDSVERVGNLRIIQLGIETMRTFGYANEFILDAVAFKFPCHLFRLFEWNVCVLVAVQQQSRGVIFGDVTRWTKGIKSPWLQVRIMACYLFRPKPLLAAIEIEMTSLILTG